MINQKGSETARGEADQSRKDPETRLNRRHKNSEHNRHWTVSVCLNDHRSKTTGKRVQGTLLMHRCMDFVEEGEKA